MKIIADPDLTPYTTLGVKASARALICIDRPEELTELYQNGFFNQKYELLSGGSNVLFIRDFFDGSILHLQIKGQQTQHLNDETIIVRFGAGEIWEEMIKAQIESGWGGGLENLSLIPGCVGAAPIQNIGAYGVEQKDAFEYLTGFDMESGSFRLFEKGECRFGYRDSIFKRALKGKIIITQVAYRFVKGAPLHLSYGNLKDEVLKRHSDPTALTVREAVIAIRKSKLPDPKETGNAGSFFKNPILFAEDFVRVADRIPSEIIIPLANGGVKIPAGALIERAGLKGYRNRKGNVGTYPLQALVIVHYGGATGAEVWAFAQEIIARVEDRFGIRLEPEVNIVQ